MCASRLNIVKTSENRMVSKCSCIQNQYSNSLAKCVGITILMNLDDKHICIHKRIDKYTYIINILHCRTEVIFFRSESAHYMCLKALMASRKNLIMNDEIINNSNSLNSRVTRLE